MDRINRIKSVGFSQITVLSSVLNILFKPFKIQSLYSVRQEKSHKIPKYSSNRDGQDEQDEMLWIQPDNGFVVYPEYPVYPCQN